MRRSDTLTVPAAAQTMARTIFVGTFPRAPGWYQTLTGQLLPPPIREAFGYRNNEAERRAARRAVEWIRGIYPLLPARLRYVGPYQEAQARLLGQTQPDSVSQIVNLFWIGRRQLAR